MPQGDVLERLNAMWQQRYPGLAILQFSPWTRWGQRSNLNGLHNVGVYILAKYEKKEVPHSPDPLDKDVVYIGGTNIGETTSLRKRLDDFHRAAFGTGGNHGGGTSYKRSFGTDQVGLCVSVCPIFWIGDKATQPLDDADYIEFVVVRVVRWIEVCLRGSYVYQWGRLPRCNKV